MTFDLERLADQGDYEHYIISIGRVTGEVIGHPRYSEAGITEMLLELRRFINKLEG